MTKVGFDPSSFERRLSRQVAQLPVKVPSAALKRSPRTDHMLLPVDSFVVPFWVVDYNPNNDIGKQVITKSGTTWEAPGTDQEERHGMPIFDDLQSPVGEKAHVFEGLGSI